MLKCAAAIATFATVAIAGAQTPSTWGYYLGGHPHPTLDSTGHEYKAVAAAEQGEVGIRLDGSVVAAGGDVFGELSFPPNFKALSVAAGCNHTLFVKPDHTVAAFGYIDVYQVQPPPGLTDVVQVAAGIEHSLALKDDGTVVAWGANYYGQISVPGDLTNVAKIFAGGGSSYALKADGTVVGWGYIPVPSGLSNVIDIKAGASYTLFLKADGTVEISAPYNWEGIADLPAGMTDIVKIGGGWNTAIAIKADGTVYAWGDNRSGQCEVPSSLDPATVKIDGGSFRMIALSGVAGSLTPSRSSVYGGTSTALKATINLASPASKSMVFTLESDDPYDITLPSTVTIPAGASSATFTIDHGVIGTNFPVTIQATYGPSTFSTTVTLLPITIKSLAFDASRIQGDTTITGFLTLSKAPKKDLVIDLETDGPIATVPTTVTVRGGATAAGFTVNLADVPLTARANITATLRGNAKAAYVEILPKVKLHSVVVSASSLCGNQKAIGTVVLRSAAGAGGITVNLSTTAGGVTVPSTVHVPEGFTVANFDVTANDVSAAVSTSIVASYSYTTVARAMKVKPTLVSAVTLNPSTITGGQTTELTVELANRVDVDTVVDISSSNPIQVGIPATIVIPAGSSQASVTLTTLVTEIVRNPKIRATKHGKVKFQILTINP